ncbi:MAG: hypothetical protein JOZ18_01940 [Chloroflexi bacterium]|nr:hypothetical protein [Chloroflexota bacterium]
MTIQPSSKYKILRETIDRLQESVEAQQETIKIVEDKGFMTAFRRGVEDMEAGRIIPWEEVKKELGLS